MRTELLGLELTRAEEILAAQGIAPEVTVTAAPKTANREGTLRVVFASDDGKEIIASRFVDPIAEAQSKQ